MASGFSPDKLADPAQAVHLIQDKEILLRIATFFGFTGAIVRALYLAGFAGTLRDKTPNRATAILYFGILGTIGHGMVALCFYLGFPTLIQLAGHFHEAAVHSWGAFQAITNGFLGLGNLLLGLTLLIAGSAIISKGAFPKGLGIVGIVGGTAAVISVIITATMFDSLGYPLYMLSILLSITFDVWVGQQLLKKHSQEGVKEV